MESRLAPEPTFRHVTARADAAPPASWASLATLSASCTAVGAAAGSWHGGLACGLVASAGLAARDSWRRRRERRYGARPARMDIVPWGVIAELGGETRILRWGAITTLDVDTVYGRDQATDVVRRSVVRVQTSDVTLVGHVYGEAALESLHAHLAAYAREGEHTAAADLEGHEAAGDPWEPQVERLLIVLRQMTRGGMGLARREGGYRGAGGGGHDVGDRLGTVLRDRAAKCPDPRPLGLLLAAELGLGGLAADLVRLSVSPHPLTAAAARAAGASLGVSRGRLGTVEEVAPFLPAADVEALVALAGETNNDVARGAASARSDGADAPAPEMATTPAP